MTSRQIGKDQVELGSVETRGEEERSMGSSRKKWDLLVVWQGMRKDSVVVIREEQNEASLVT